VTVDQPQRVVVDANVLVENFRPSNAFKLLLEGARTGQLVLVVPELALKEAANKFRERIWERVKDIDQAVAKTLALGVACGVEPDLEPDAEAIRYEHGLRRTLAEVHAVVPPLPDVSHDTVVQRALERRKPFNRGGSGYRDALIWESVLDQARSREAVIFCTRDRTDFGNSEDPPALAADLVADLANSGLGPDSVTLALDYRALVNRLVDVERVAVDEVERALRRLWPDLEKAVEAALYDLEFDFDALSNLSLDRFDVGFGAETPDRVVVRDAQVVGVSSLSHATVEEARVLSDDEVLVTLYLEVEGDLDLDVEITGAGRGTPDRWERERWRMSRTMAVSRTIAASTEATYVRSEGTLVGLAVFSGRVL
jgi:hypothetical protein